ncbi:cadmium-translocating P-type ATPase [Leptospira langatensis]|uniref:Cadmium-translocating P-type ATPase n=1 Tax=Leptospira langatensis TaxID=2484983 RepID=A0A5F1ZWZ1_9LEPT|nr:heavy metal translocating P-type ATPase [Leptospira langatensis]TGJ98458.1 cadmium-translocating P-type ATPase [Leptospira langatensis]TGL43372.1 cadmium-translocating P-type ATPase [Leptospira langatensis]
MSSVLTKTLCFHCNSPIEGTPIFRVLKGEEREYCCNGCAELSSMLLENGLDRFYEIRGGQTMDPIRNGSSEEGSSPDYDNESVYSEYLEKTKAGYSGLITVSGIHCSACVWLIETVLPKTDGVQDARLNFGTGRLKVEFDPSKVRLSSILKLIRKLGYSPSLYSPLKAESKVEKPFRDLGIRMAVAGFCWGNIMLFSASLYAGYFQGMDVNMKNLFHYVSWMLATPVFFYSGYPFWKGAFEAWKHKLLSMDVLLFIGVSLAYFYSIYVTVSERGEVYFDSVCTIYFFILLGKYLEAMIRYKAGTKIGELLSLLPEEYEVQREGTWSKFPARNIQKGDLVKLVHGSKAPVDGALKSQEAFFDEAVLTGESEPIRRTAGEEIKAGSLCLSSDVLFLSSGTSQESSLAQIGKLLEESLLRKPKIQRTTDRMASVFIKIVLVIAICTFFYWWKFDGLESALLNTISVLIVACPCALGLSVPAALVVSHLLQSKEGVLIKSPETAETLARVDRIFFDKTGTLTVGKLELARELILEKAERADEYRSIAVDLERHSSHPVARSFTKAFALTSEGPISWNSLEELPGQGMEGRIGDSIYRIGNRKFTSDSLYENDGLIYLSKDMRLLAAWEFKDKERAEAQKSISKLRSLVQNLEILSGDIPAKVKELASKLSISEYSANLSPTQKRDRILDAQSQGEIVAMVGDGINDSACIAQADIGISMGMGSDLSLDRSDIILTKNRLDSLPKSISIARKTRAIIRQNICLSLVYNSIMIPLAFSGLMLPVICAGFMTLSSFTVVLNSVSMRSRIQL